DPGFGCTISTLLRKPEENIHRRLDGIGNRDFVEVAYSFFDVRAKQYADIGFDDAIVPQGVNFVAPACGEGSNHDDAGNQEILVENRSQAGSGPLAAIGLEVGRVYRPRRTWVIASRRRFKVPKNVANGSLVRPPVPVRSGKFSS